MGTGGHMVRMNTIIQQKNTVQGHVQALVLDKPVRCQATPN